MSLPRVVMITRRFWPIIGGTEIMLSRLASGLQARGATTTVLTAQLQPAGAAEFDHQGVHVVRFAQPGNSFASTCRYLWQLREWLLEHRASYDLVYVSTLRHDAYAALGATRRTGCPTVLRAEHSGLAGDCHWQLDATCGRRIKRRCARASALVATSRMVERELIAAGYPRDRIHYIPRGVPLLAPHTTERRNQARATLAEANAVLAISSRARLALYVGRLDAEQGLEGLLEAWAMVARRRPEAQLWLLGDGPLRQRLLDRISELGLLGHATVAGAYDDLEDFWDAADLFVHPSPRHEAPLALLEAMAAGLPVIAAATTAHRDLIESGRHGELIEPGDPESWAAAIDGLWNLPDTVTRLGTDARDRASTEFSLDDVVDRHLELFERLGRKA